MVNNSHWSFTLTQQQLACVQGDASEAEQKTWQECHQCIFTLFNTTFCANSSTPEDQAALNACDPPRMQVRCCEMHEGHACHMHEPGSAARMWTCEVWWAAHIGAAHICNIVWCIRLSNMHPATYSPTVPLSVSRPYCPALQI